jgi:hypothetical protein
MQENVLMARILIVDDDTRCAHAARCRLKRGRRRIPAGATGGHVSGGGITGAVVVCVRVLNKIQWRLT